MRSREINRNTQYNMREWLSGGAPPCQGGGRGFDPRLALEKRTIPNRYRSFFRALPGLESSMSTLRSGRRRRTSPGCSATPRALFYKDIQCGCPFFVKKSFTSGVYYKKLLEKVYELYGIKKKKCIRYLKEK